MFVGLQLGGIMGQTSRASRRDSKIGATVVLREWDNTDPARKMRRTTVRIPGVMYKTRVWFEEVGAERIPQKSIKIMRSAYKKTQMDYWLYLELGQLDKAVQKRKRAQHMSKYVKSPDPDTEPHVSLKK
jgi:hypothetical protein